MSLASSLPPRPAQTIGLPSESPHGGAGVERALIDAVERAVRAPRGRLAMALHLSHLKAPAPRAYHTRIALALMQDAAHRSGGQVFSLRNADIVLLGDTADAHGLSDRPPAPFVLPEALQRLFGADAPDARLTTVWRLDQDAASFRQYIGQCLAGPAAPGGPRDDAGATTALASLTDMAMTADPRPLCAQQTAVQLRPGKGLPLSARLAPLFRELVFVPASLRAHAEASLLGDPLIVRYLGDLLQRRILAMLLDDLDGGGPLTRPCLLQAIPIHVNLSPDAIISPAFARLVQLAAKRGVRLGVEVAATDIAAEPALTAFARMLLAQAGIQLILDGIDHAGLIMVDVAAIAPGLVKLAWSPRMADGPAELLNQLDRAVAAIGPARIVLQDADGEAALVWGQGHGIHAFQGPYMDAVQAASRIAICAGARGCTLRQCTNRGLALDARGRGGCFYPGLLDMTPFAGRAGA